MYLLCTRAISPFAILAGSHLMRCWLASRLSGRQISPTPFLLRAHLRGCCTELRLRISIIYTWFTFIVCGRFIILQTATNRLYTKAPCVRSSDHGCTIAVLDWRSGLSKGGRALRDAEFTQLGVYQAGRWALFGIKGYEYFPGAHDKLHCIRHHSVMFNKFPLTLKYTYLII